MSCHSQHHQQLNDQGEGKCGVPMWYGYGGDAGFCDKPAYGKQPPCQEVWNAHWGQYQRTDGFKSRSGLVCPAHGGPSVRTFRDGNAWCCVHPDFINLQESPAGFGATPEEARAALESALTQQPKPHGSGVSQQSSEGKGERP